MKITDGMWQVREGMFPQYAAEAYDVDESADGLTVYAPVRPIEHRGSVLNIGLLTVRLTAPLPGLTDPWRSTKRPARNCRAVRGLTRASSR